MDVSLTLIVIMAVLFACGVYAMLERSLTRVLIGFLLLGNATNLLLLIVMGVPGNAPFFGTEGELSDPLPQALTLTAIVITFAVSAFLLALIYRSWQLGQADTVEDDEADIALRERTDADEDLMDDEADADDDSATTDFVGVQTAPITVLHMRDHPAIHDDAPVDRAYASQAPRDDGGSSEDGHDAERESSPESDERSDFRADADTHASDADETDAADAAHDTAADTASDDSAPEHTDDTDREDRP
ncbi:Na(+)/H(+) antiporter subunit C [Microbacterium sp. ANT_H45B]|uniref:Na(+)/H(+) antiporter subunit C n=1 Tax=Microbacterium sp. ANT_H45B TaxID=2597346 RepID=UPI0021CD30E7|nr:Na(+)/H(+) antiporter subunit C [Microbacterium sp. ANT_H45B]